MKILLALPFTAMLLLAQKPAVEGLADSPVRVVIYEDLQCPDCAAFEQLLSEKLLPRYAAKVAFVHRDFPLAKHVWARRAAIAARFFASRTPALGLEYRRFVMANQPSITDANFNDRLTAFAKLHQIEPAEAIAAISDSRLAGLVEQDYQDGVARGVIHTPTVFVNGKPYIETIPYEDISKGIDEALGETRHIVTGASRGIGRAIAVDLAATHHVIATYHTNLEAARALASETGADIVRCDVSSAADRAALIAYARHRFHRLDLLVNNAGIAPRQRCDVLDASEASFDELIATNLKGPHFLTALAAAWMLEHGAGRIVFITSISAYAASLNRAEYCISKAGLSMSASIFAQRLAPAGIQVFEIRPGIIRTDMTAAVEQSYTARVAAGLLPQPRLGEGIDVARAVRAIAAGLLDYSAGQILDVDGGFRLRGL